MKQVVPGPSDREVSPKKPENSSKKKALVGISITLGIFLILVVAIFSGSHSNNITSFCVIDTATNKVTATVPVGDYPFRVLPTGVAVNPAGTKVYVANEGNFDEENDGIVSVIDTATNAVTTTVSVGGTPFGIAVNPEGTKVYVAEFDNVQTFNSNMSEENITLNSNMSEENITLHSEENYTVSVIDTATNKVTATVPLKIFSLDEMILIFREVSGGVVVTPNGTRLYVAYEGNLAEENDGTVSVIDTATNTVIAIVNVGGSPSGVAVTPDGIKVYVTNTNDNKVYVIDTATNNVTATVPVGIWPTGVAVNPAGTKVYVANEGSLDKENDGTVSVIDTATDTVTAIVNVGGIPSGVTITPDGTKVYVTNWDKKIISVIDTATSTVTAIVNVGFHPEEVAVNPAGTKVYICEEPRRRYI